MESSVGFLHTLSNLTPRLVDLLDIAVVGFLFYGALGWLRRSRSRALLMGILPLLGLYLLARTLEMQVTLMLFRLVVALGLVALVVVFQEEIRRTFERLARSRPVLGRREAPPWRSAIDVVVESVARLAANRTGALIVFRGKEPLSRHLTGGDALGGVPSPPLLYSLFDDSSDGHDGAVIIEEGQVSRFGVHLPLSTGAVGIDRMGTRHTAALGLSERSDALVVVVSEERGVISVAAEGELVEVSPGTLSRRLEAFFGALYPEERVGHLRQLLTRDLGLKALSLVVAAVLWAVLVGLQSQTEDRSFEVPISYRNVPAELLLEQPQPERVRVTLTGTRGAFEQLRPEQLLVAIDAGELERGSNQVAIRDEDIERPLELRVERVEPSYAVINAQDAVVREMAVTARTTGELPPGLRLKGLRVEPERVEFSVPRTERVKAGDLRAAPIELSTITTTTTLTRPLLLPVGAQRTAATPEDVRVTVEITETGADRTGPGLR